MNSQFFSVKINNQIITKDMFLDAINYVICFVENHFNCNLEKYRNALFVFKSLIKAVNNIKDHKPSKEFFKQSCDVLEEVLNYNADEKTQKQNRENCALCKLLIERVS